MNSLAIGFSHRNIQQNPRHSRDARRRMAADLDSLDAKVAYFKQLNSLSEADDDFDAPEETHRQLHRSFFRPAPAVAAPSLVRHQSLPAKPQRNQDMTPRRVTPAPQPESEQVIRGTQSGNPKPKGRLGALLNAESDVVHETPAAEPTRREVGDATPVPAVKRLLSSTGEDSPSLGAATKKTKKRRVSEPKVRPEEEQIFKGLSFFYVPDNDIAPARRLRINKAKEFGAAWTRNVLTATHVVAEKNLEYRDVEKVLPRTGSLRRMPKVVNEDYPIDCIQFRSILHHNQKKYLLSGQPTAELEDKANEPPPPPPSSEESAKSLQLKPPHHNRRKWDYMPPKGTPSQTGEPSQRSVPVDSQPVMLGLSHVVESPKNVSVDDGQVQQSRPDQAPPERQEHVETIQKKDELSGYILMMQEFKHLPLDDDEGDDTHSVMGQSEAQSDVERSSSENESARRRKSSRKSRPTRKAITFEDRFSCNRAGEKNANAENPNARTIEVLQSMNDYYGRINDHWRTLAYRKAISTLKRQDVKITTEEEAFRLPSIGRRLAQKIDEIVTTNKLKRLEYAQDEPTDPSLQMFLKIYGVGNKQAEQWIAQGMRTLDDVRQKAKLTPSQMMGVEHYDDLNTRIPRREATALGEVVKKTAGRVDPEAQLIIGGSYRRGAESSHDIDFIVTKPNTNSTAELRGFLDDLVRQLERDKFLVARLASSRAAGDGSKWHGCCVLPRIKGFNDDDDDNYRPVWRRIDFLLVPESEMGAALIYFTGNDIFNRSMRLLASKKGFRLNQRGLYKNVLRGADRAKVTEGELVEGRDERRIFEILGVKWREPHERWC